MSLLSKIFLFFALSLIAACGFEPMYGKHGQSTAVSTKLASVRIDNIPEREGQLLRIALEDRFNSQSVPTNPLYDLKITLKKTVVPVIVRPDGSIERYNIYLKSQFSLVRAADGKEVLKGEVNRISSSNVSDADFASYVTKEDSTRRSLEEMAEEYKFRLAGWLGKH